MSNLTNIAIGLSVVGLLLVRQMQPRPAKETSSIRLALALGVIGIAEIRHAIGGHHLTATTVAWLVLSLLAGAGLGALRAATVSIWQGEDGSAWRQGTILTAALWLVSLATHLVLDAVIDHSTRTAALGTSSILLYLAVTLGVQREIVRWRAAHQRGHSQLAPGPDPRQDRVPAPRRPDPPRPGRGPGLTVLRGPSAAVPGTGPAVSHSAPRTEGTGRHPASARAGQPVR